jgi:hypothetical protein
VFKWYCISPWAKADELVLYVFAIGELKQSGLKAAEMGLEPEPKEFLCSATKTLFRIPTKEYLGME